MERTWDLILHFDARGKLFLKREYKTEGHFNRNYVMNPDLAKEMLDLLRTWHREHGQFFSGGTFKLNNYGEILRNKKVIGKVMEFPSFIDFIVDRRIHQTVCPECKHVYFLFVNEAFSNGVAKISGKCDNGACTRFGTVVDYFDVRFIDKGHLAGLPEFEYEHEVNLIRLYKCLADEHNLYWRNVQ